MGKKQWRHWLINANSKFVFIRTWYQTTRDSSKGDEIRLDITYCCFSTVNPVFLTPSFHFFAFYVNNSNFALIFIVFSDYFLCEEIIIKKVSL